MLRYIDHLNAIFATTTNQNQLLGYRACFKNLSGKSALILGINPSNSIQAFKRSKFKQALEVYNELPQEIFSNQDAYNHFLSFENHERSQHLICKLENLSHRYHPHFQKHNLFAEALGIADTSSFFDLYPIWEIEQGRLLKKMQQNRVLSQQLITAFTDLLVRNSQIKTLCFFNTGAFDTFIKQINLDSKTCLSEVKEIKLNIAKRQIPSTVKKCILTINSSSQIELIGFGIGSYSFGREACLQLAAAYKNTL